MARPLAHVPTEVLIQSIRQYANQYLGSNPILVLEELLHRLQEAERTPKPEDLALGSKPNPMEYS